MEVQAVELVTRHGIDLLLHKLFAAEMSGHINHESPIVKSRSILYFHRCYFQACAIGRLRQLHQCLQSVE